MADVIEITAEVRERELRLTSIPMMPSGSRSHLQIRVTFDAEWEGTTKTLVAYRDLSHPYHAPLGLDGTALIPHEVLAEQGVVYLGVFGVAGDQRITSTIVRYGVNEGALTDGLQPSDPTPEMWDQLISAVTEVRQAAESAMRDAQNSAQSAGERANAAATSAQQAQESQTAAEESATSAQASATEATKQATAAEGAAVRAESAATEVEQSAQQIAGAIDRLAIHETAAGNPAVIWDSADWQMEGLRVYGQSEQVTTRGVNIARVDDQLKKVDLGAWENTTKRVLKPGEYGCGLTTNNYFSASMVTDLVLSDGVIRFKTKGTGYGVGIGVSLIEGEQYTPSCKSKSGRISVIFYREDGTYISNSDLGQSFVVPSGARYSILLIRDDNGVADLEQIQLETGAPATAYEPYTGGKPSPSPEYPQEIVSKTVDQIVVTGKNLINQPTLSFTHFTKIDLTNPLRPDTYTFSGVATTAAESDALLISCLDDAGKLVVSVYIPVDGRKHHTVSVSRRVAALQIYAARSNALAIEKNAQLRDLQIELGSVATPYEPYHAQTITLSAPLTLRGVPVTSGGNVTISGKQYMADLITERDGVVGVERRVKLFPLTGDEEWFTWGANDSGNIGFYLYYNKLVDIGKITNGHSVCSIIGKNAGAFAGGQPGCWVASSPTPDGRYIIISIPQSSLVDVSTKNAAIQSFKDLLKKLGNVEYLAMLHEPAFEPLPEADQQAIRSLRTYHGNTVVTAGAWTEVDYVADPKLYIDKKIAEISAAIVAR